jgi:hypothetical protein
LLLLLVAMFLVFKLEGASFLGTSFVILLSRESQGHRDSSSLGLSKLIKAL